ncbi:TPA: hypothetical protein N0F65_012440 [Lagenidium giganteum]|uniref:Fatty acid hydroxylase domain-containing protein n=1 Tax=Lagenidium giganteum TaxID=4803 RepID=A0AAV2YJA5_9STRA|nr:TPA: hypothetical protein N0F65_012440 [Lagenidium giganteum]
MLGPFLVGAHLSVMMLWMCLRLMETIDAHSGYQFPWSFTQLMDGAKRHDYHHSHNVGMYGGIMLFWDWIFGTDKPYYEHQAKLRSKKLA